MRWPALALAVVTLSSMITPLGIIHGGGGVQIKDVETIPAHVMAGEVFRIRAVVVNNSDSTITYRGLCESPISAEFDRHVRVEYAPACLGFTIHELKPGESAEVTGPPSGTIYRAVSSGMTRANITFTYYVDDRMMSTSTALEFNIVKDSPAELDRPFSMKIDSIVRIIDRSGKGGLLLIRFADVLEDSRCPEGAHCIRAGSATVMLEVTSVHGSMYLDLAVGDMGYDARRIMGYTVSLLDVRPYPRVDGRIEKDEYAIELLVSNSIPVEHGAVKGHGYDGKRMMMVWNEHSKRGFMILGSDAIRFTVERKECENGYGYDVCFSAILQDGKSMDVKINYDSSLRIIVDSRPFDVKRMMVLSDGMRVEYTEIMLGEGEEDGPLLVMDVEDIDYVAGINYQKYPTEATRPVILEFGDTVSDGCTVTLKFVGVKGGLTAKPVVIEEASAIFIKEVVDRGRCPMYTNPTSSSQHRSP
ncbi:MAG: hypothetical protein RMJ59_06555 [Candidatus Nitrosocaldus sp.]|nr:hypothetical protein [Candidatus Nitrosocaldus sp.]MDW8276020.1 hypothetical protein [Candidatus Nitrosocaldus sp.]